MASYLLSREEGDDVNRVTRIVIWVTRVFNVFERSITLEQSVLVGLLFPRSGQTVQVFIPASKAAKLNNQGRNIVQITQSGRPAMPCKFEMTTQSA